MTPKSVSQQIHEGIERLIRAGLSARQCFPKYEVLPDGAKSIGHIAGTAAALKNIPYRDVYAELDRNDAYHVKTVDGALFCFQYLFSKDDVLTKHRLAFFPSVDLPTIEQSPEIYGDDDLYADVAASHTVRFPIRFDYDPASHIDMWHPKSHLTLGQVECCRIPIAKPLSPNTFLLFIIKNFYRSIYLRNKNIFDKKMAAISHESTITKLELGMSHFVVK